MPHYPIGQIVVETNSTYQAVAPGYLLCGETQTHILILENGQRLSLKTFYEEHVQHSRERQIAQYLSGHHFEEPLTRRYFLMRAQDQAAWERGEPIEDIVDPDLRLMDGPPSNTSYFVSMRTLQQDGPLPNLTLYRRHQRLASKDSFADRTDGVEVEFYEYLATGTCHLFHSLHFALPCDTQDEYLDLKEALEESALAHLLHVHPWGATKDRQILAFELGRLPQMLVEQILNNTPGEAVIDKDIHRYILQHLLGLEITV